MKKIYTLITFISLGFSLIAQNGQIVNGDFESWQDDQLYETPTEWKSSNTDEFYGVEAVSKSTDAEDGTFSCLLAAQLVGNDTLTPYVYHGRVSNVNGGGPDQGIAYSDNFEAVRLSYKSDLQVGDSLQLLVIRFLAGTVVEFQVKPIAFGVNNIWTSSLIYLGNQPQDSLFIGFIVGDVIGDTKPSPSSWAMIDNIQLISGAVETSPLPNHSFENWNNVTVENPSNWYTVNTLLAGSNSENAIKSIDANSGNFALELSTVLINSDTIGGFLSIGSINFNNLVTPFAPIPYTAEPTTFSGAYKYSPVNGDAAGIQVVFYQSGTPIGSHYEPLSSQATYTNFSSTISTGGVPDSISFLAFSGDNPGSVLKLDDLQLSGGNVSVTELSAIDFEIYPNPSSDLANIKLPSKGSYSIVVSDLKGAVLSTSINITGKHTIDTKTLEKGTYFVHVSNESISQVKKLIVN